MTLIDFVALSQSTSMSILALLVIARRSKPSKTLVGNFSVFTGTFLHVYALAVDPIAWTLLIILSLTLLTFPLALTFILFLDMHVNEIYIKKGNIFSHHGDLVPVNFSLYCSNTSNLSKQ